MPAHHPAPIHSDKARVIAAIRALLQETRVETQEDLRRALRGRGLRTNQAMISRILHRLGAVKMDEDDRTVYRLPAERVPITAKNALHQLILDISSNETLVVIHTTPGSAQLVARLLDQQKPLGVLGTVAGDDTLFIAPASTRTTRALQRAIARWLGSVKE